MTATFEEVKKVVKKPAQYLIDVRNEDELEATGVIPATINIPLSSLEVSLKMSPDAFQQKYSREKPNFNSIIIFTCQSGARAKTASEMAQKLGFNNTKVYTGSWNEWSQKIKAGWIE